MAIPTAESVSPQWLTECLRNAGYKSASVAAFTATGIGTGQIGKCVRFTLDYESGADAAPATLVGKFPSDDPMSRQTGVMLRNYYREVNFYRSLAADLTISTPLCYHADIDAEGPEFVLLLEDMHPASQGDQLAGCSPDVARAAVLELVGLQAPTWCDDTLKQHDWLVEPEDGPLPSALELYRNTLPGFVERYGSKLAPDQVEIISRVAESPDCPVFSKPADLFCLEHVDYRLDNMLIDTTGPEPSVTVVDWQSVRVGKPLNDVGYFLGAGLVPEDRRIVEEDIVRSYHRALNESGVETFDWSRCWEEYRKGAFSGFAVTVIASMIVQQTERGDRMFVTMADRHSRHALDLGASEFLA